ncbi:hemin receptor [Aeromicrobium sp. Root495]|uniref:heme/hemin ABC transporter substrate-binding protein n=1 Tax=Aeromicrobium sp. Root495 TaxID=1736550 RepID=UPI0006FE6E1B|nr:ABC transporter substrate-binding protein [Aeromicrobium sp. Root495]KQY59983.1 hemin receptor [Aeromicrobium sp. Root495]
MRCSWARLGAVAVAATLVAACAGPGGSPEETAGAGADLVPLSQVEPAADPKALKGPSTATLADRAVEPVADSPKQSLPVTVTSKDRAGDRKVVVKDTSRVVAMNLSGSIATTVWGLGLGETLVGRDQAAEIPGTRKIPVVTSGGHSVNAEAVLDLEPTLVITDGSVGPRDVVEQLRDAGVTVVFIDDDSSFDGAQQMARDVAAVYGVPETGKLLAQQIDEQVEAVQQEVERIAPEKESDRLRMIFLYLRGSAGIYYLFGEESGADDLIDGLGGVDVAEELGWEGMRPMTDEAIVEADPDVILVMTDGIRSTGGVDGLLADKPAIALTTAGKNRRFVDMADSDILSFGPRSAGVVDALARAVYAPEPPS